MQSLFTRRLAHLALLLTMTLIIINLAPASILAQDPEPSPVVDQLTPTPVVDQLTPTPVTGEQPPVNYQGDPPLTDPTPEPVDQSDDQVVPPIEEVTDQAAPAAVDAILPEGYIPPSEIAELSNNDLAALSFPTQTQGNIKLDLVVNPERLMAGREITYTYIITNTRAEPISNFLVRARWTNFRLTNAGGIFQFCKELNCRPAAVEGNLDTTIATDVAAPSNTEIVYRISSTLNPNQSGRFSVVLNTRNDQYPISGQAPKRPAGSAQLVLSATTPMISEDTANALFVGPVLILTKIPSPASKLIYVGDTAEFTITVSNATATADLIDGRTRTDAIPATNLVLEDRLPPGSQFISADGPVQAVADPKVGPVRWLIPGPIKPGESYSVKVRFAKLDLATGCGSLSNNDYNVTSDEMPFQTATTRYSIRGSGANIAVRTPVVISVSSVTPSAPIFGEEATITFKVESYWSQAISNLEVRYNIQSNAWYVPGKASPAPFSAPNGTSMGGEVVWKLNMPAGTINTPATQLVSLVIRGDYTSGGSGTAKVSPPAPIPLACLQPINRGVGFQPRLLVSKLPGPNETTSSVVHRKDTYTYLFQLQNKGTTNVTNASVTDVLPGGTANFSYVVGSATLNRQAYEPDELDIQNGAGGSIIWRGISVPAGETISLQFDLVVDGLEFYDYCNGMSATLGNEPVSIGRNRVCVRINPPIRLEKTVSRTTIDGNNVNDTKEVTFTLKIINEDNQSYDVALYDIAGSFEFLRMLSGASDPTRIGTTGHIYEWPRMTLTAGQSSEVSFVARLVPDRCANGKYNNDLNFRFWPSNGSTSYTVASIPQTRVTIQYICGTAAVDNNLISYSKVVDVATVSLRDRHLFTVNVRNENPAGGAARPNVQIVDVLPSGFTYAGMGPSSGYKQQPTVTQTSDGRTQLTWTIPSIAANAASNVQFYARSGDIVGTFTNKVRVKSDGMIGVRGCSSDMTQSCSGYVRETENNVVQIYATRDVKVDTLATTELSINSTNCSNAGDIRTYKIALVNTNRHAYSSTQVTATLPLGLHLQGLGTGTPSPQILSQNVGGTVLVWKDLTLPQKPSNASMAQIVLELKLLVGNVWGPMQPKVEALSPDGSLPKKDGVLDPIVSLCVQNNQPSIGLDATKRRLLQNEEFSYVISLINPTSTPVTLSIEDVLNSKLAYVASVQGAQPTVSGPKLTWSSIQIPAAANNAPAVMNIIFKVKVAGSETGTTILNVAKVTQSSVPMNSDNADVEVFIMSPNKNTYLPIIRR